MRKIRFRGKSVYDGELYGGVGVCVDPDIKTEKLSEKVGKYVPYTQKAYVYSPFDEKFEVDPNTVGQYTGYKDIHKNNIYEGDIIKYPRYNGSDFILIGEVKFGEYKQDGSDGEYAPSICCGFYVEIKKCIYPDWCDPDDYSDFIQDYEKQNSIAEIINDSGNVEVIGNIYI